MGFGVWVLGVWGLGLRKDDFGGLACQKLDSLCFLHSEPKSCNIVYFSRMRSRRVPVLRLGSRGPGGDARSLRLCSPSVRKRPRAFASVRKRPQAFASVRKRLQASASVGECRASSGIANRRETQNCRHFLRFSVPKVSTVTGIGGGVVAKRRCRRTVVTFGLVPGLRVLKVSTVTGIRGVVVAKRRTFVTFGLAFGERKGERKGERREEKREMRGEERREERREEESG